MTPLPSLVQRFFTDRLYAQLAASPNTIAAYRDTFRLLLQFASEQAGKPPTKLTLEELDVTLVADFLTHMEDKRGNSARSRNARLASIRSFFRFVAMAEPAHLLRCQRILAMPGKRYERRAVEFLNRAEMNALLAAPDRNTWTGRRDHAILSLALQTGLRVSEIIHLRRHDIDLGTRQEAIEAEANRRIHEQKKRELAKAGAGVDAEVPKTLATLLEEFFRQHADEHLAPKTVERYREQAVYISPELLTTPLTEITPLRLTREWSRLLKSGGHTRKTKAPRPLSGKTVRNIAGVVSSALARAIKWGLATINPVTNSELPKVRKHRGIALTPAQQRMVIDAAAEPWCLRTFLEVVAATGCRRGEVLALRWRDIEDGRAMIARSLTQTRDVLTFKGTKTYEPRPVSLPASAIAALNAHRQSQDEFRREFGPDYRADLDLIFANPDGSPLKPDSISAAVSLLFRRLKLPKGASLHSLRHTHTSHLLASGVPLPAISARLGHASIRTTQEIYSHMIHGQDDEAARKWEEFQNQPAGGAQQQKQVQ